MSPGIRRSLPSTCYYDDCSSNSSANEGPVRRRIVRRGFYRRSSDSREIPRYFCNHCSRYFSAAVFSACFRQKRRKLNEPIQRALVSGVSQRRIARNFGINYKTDRPARGPFALIRRLSQSSFGLIRATENRKMWK